MVIKIYLRFNRNEKLKKEFYDKFNDKYSLLIDMLEKSNNYDDIVNSLNENFDIDISDVRDLSDLIADNDLDDRLEYFDNGKIEIGSPI